MIENFFETSEKVSRSGIWGSETYKFTKELQDFIKTGDSISEKEVEEMKDTKDDIVNKNSDNKVLVAYEPLDWLANKVSKRLDVRDNATLQKWLKVLAQENAVAVNKEIKNYFQKSNRNSKELWIIVNKLWVNLNKETDILEKEVIEASKRSIS